MFRRMLMVVGFPVLSLLYLWQAWLIETPHRVPVQPGAFPVLVGCVMVVAAFGAAWRELRSRSTDSAAPASKIEQDPARAVSLEDEPDPSQVAVDGPSPPSLIDVAVILAIYLVYAVFFMQLGFFLSTAIGSLALTTYFSPRLWIRNVLFSVVFSLALTYLFANLLSVLLPAGIYTPGFLDAR